MQTQIVMLEAGGYAQEHSIRCEIGTLRQLIKLTEIGYDIDLTRFSGKEAQKLPDTSLFVNELPKDLQEAVKQRISASPLGALRQ